MIGGWQVERLTDTCLINRWIDSRWVCRLLHWWYLAWLVGPMSELLCFVLESGRLERQRTRSDRIIAPGSMAKGTHYYPFGFSAWVKVDTECLSSSVFFIWFFFLIVMLYLLFSAICWICVFKFSCRDGDQTENSQTTPKLHRTFSGFQCGSLVLTASVPAPHWNSHCLWASHWLTKDFCLSPKGTSSPSPCPPV